MALLAPSSSDRRSRFLSASQASACENAKTDPRVCQCRCGGAYHGVNAQRAAEGLDLRPDTWDLEESDPHFSRPPTCQSRERVEEERHGLVPQATFEKIPGLRGPA